MSSWDNACSICRDNNMVSILTWRDMKAEMRHCFVPANYTRSLYDKLTNLKQGTKPVDEYYQEMELIMQRARVREPAEQTMQRFLQDYHIRLAALFVITSTMTWLSCCTRRARLKLPWLRRLNLHALLRPDHVFLHGHHQLDSLLLGHGIQ